MSLNKEKKLDIMMIFKECIPMFSVLADEKRQEIILILSEQPESINVNAITKKNKFIKTCCFTSP